MILAFWSFRGIIAHSSVYWDGATGTGKITPITFIGVFVEIVMMTGLVGVMAGSSIVGATTFFMRVPFG